MTAKNLVSGTLADDITTSTTNILVHIADNISAQGITDFFPTTPFYITIMPKSPAIGVSNHLDSEIIKITNVGHDQVGNAALTGVRAQRDTTAKAFSTGDIVTVGVYAEDAVFLSEDGTTETCRKQLKDKDGNVIYPVVGILGTDDIANSAITTAKIANGAITPKKASFTAYSPTETVVGTWIDGKPIYRKVVQITDPKRENTDYVVISNVINSVIRLYGYMVGNGSKFPVPQTDSSSTYSVVFVQPNGTLRGRFSYIGTVPDLVRVVVEYTKSTD